MRLIIPINEDELTEEEIAECIRIAEANFSGVVVEQEDKSQAKSEDKE